MILRHHFVRAHQMRWARVHLSIARAKENVALLPAFEAIRKQRQMLTID